MGTQKTQLLLKPMECFGKLIAPLALYSVLAGCSDSRSISKVPDNADIRETLINLAQSHVQVANVLQKEAESTARSFEVVAYVDQSESMRGYVPDQGDNFYEGSEFEALLRGLAHQSELKSFIGFGTGESGQPKDINKEVRRNFGRLPPLSKDGFKLLNNNYAAVIDEVTSEFDQDRITLIITDGVQSHYDSGQGSAMGATAAAAQKWLAKGGIVDARILTAPMKGKYFSEELRALGKPYSFNVAEKDRPFLVLSFIPNTELRDEWERLMARERIASLKWKATYQLPQFVKATSPTISVADQLFDPEKSQRLGMMEMENQPVRDTRQLPQLDEKSQWQENVFAAAVSEKLLTDSRGNALAEVPLTFEISGMIDESIDAETWLRSFRLLRPSIKLYIRKDADSKEWTEAIGGNIDLSIKDPAIPVEYIREDKNKDSGIKARVTYQIPWISGSPCVAVMSLQRASEKVDPPSFSFWSTINDSTIEEMKKVYNLQTLLEQIAGESFKLTRPSGAVIYLYPVN